MGNRLHEVLRRYILTGIEVLDSDQACALGAGMFAACAAGIYEKVSDAQKAMKPGICAEYKPDKQRTVIYDSLYKKYKKFGDLSKSLQI